MPQQASAPHTEQVQPLSASSSQNQQHLPSSYTNLLGFQSFYEHFQQIYGSSYSQLHYMNSSNSSTKNPALPPPFTYLISLLALKASAQQELDHIYSCSAPLMSSEHLLPI